MMHPELHQKTFLFLLVAVTLAFLAVISSFAGSVFWGAVLAIVFAPIHARLLNALSGRQNLAALATLAMCVLIVVLPLMLLTGALLREGTLLYQTVAGGGMNAGTYFEQIVSRLPTWVVNLLDRLGLGDFDAVRSQLSAATVKGSQLIATRAVGIGQNALDFVIGTGIMLYLLFFMLRDGERLAAHIRHALPMASTAKDYLFAKFTTVIRATVKGNIIVAATQGALGGMLFWFLGIQAALLWGVLMAFLSLLPAIGAALIWGPVALYFLVTGSIGTGALIIGFGVLVIGLVDNVLRPILVGKQTHLPDYVVLISTVGGIGLFGLNGFVIGPVIAALFIAAWAIFTESDEKESGSRT